MEDSMRNASALSAARGGIAVGGGTTKTWSWFESGAEKLSIFATSESISIDSWTQPPRLVPTGAAEEGGDGVSGAASPLLLLLLPALDAVAAAPLAGSGERSSGDSVSGAVSPPLLLLLLLLLLPALDAVAAAAALLSGSGERSSCGTREVPAEVPDAGRCGDEGESCCPGSFVQSEEATTSFAVNVGVLKGEKEEETLSLSKVESDGGSKQRCTGGVSPAFLITCMTRSIGRPCMICELTEISLCRALILKCVELAT